MERYQIVEAISNSGVGDILTGEHYIIDKNSLYISSAGSIVDVYDTTNDHKYCGRHKLETFISLGDIAINEELSPKFNESNSEINDNNLGKSRFIIAKCTFGDFDPADPDNENKVLIREDHFYLVDTSSIVIDSYKGTAMADVYECPLSNPGKKIGRFDAAYHFSMDNKTIDGIVEDFSNIYKEVIAIKELPFIDSFINGLRIEFGKTYYIDMETIYAKDCIIYGDVYDTTHEIGTFNLAAFFDLVGIIKDGSSPFFKIAECVNKPKSSVTYPPLYRGNTYAIDMSTIELKEDYILYGDICSMEDFRLIGNYRLLDFFDDADII